jgi:hypothetical protein
MRFKNRLLVGLLGATLSAGGAVVVTAGSASAITPSGGCWVYSPSNPSDMEDTVPGSSTSTSLAQWADPLAAPAGPADYNIATSGSTIVGGTADISLTFNKGPKNGGPPASGTAYYYFSVNGVNLPPVSKAFTVAGAATIPGDTINTSYTIASAGAQNIVFRKVYFDIPSFLTRVACNGQSSGVGGGTNPATAPLDTNVTASFTATGPTATISAISNQVVTDTARAGDVISFNVSTFANGTGAASLCDISGGNCGSSTSVAISGGAGSGTLTVDAADATGSRTLKVTSGSDTALVPITILGTPTISTNVTGGGSGTIVTVTGTNWDPNQTVSIGGYQLAPPPPPPTSDTPVSATADASGNISKQFTVSDSTTAFIGASRTHAAGPPPTVLFASQAFTFSGDSCTAKVGTATTGSCSLIETVNLTITAGDLKMSKAAGAVTMSGISLNGAAQTSTGSLQDVTVQDYRGGILGWSLTGKFSGLTATGGFSLTPDKLSWTPSCTAAANNDDTVSVGAAGAFVDAATAKPLCSVATTALGADGTSGGDTAADAGLSLAVAANQGAGAYTGTLTLTLS